MATLQETFDAFITALHTQIQQATDEKQLGVLQQQLERISKIIQDGLNIDPDLITQIQNSVSKTTTVNGQPLSSNVNLDYSDVGAMSDDLFSGFSTNNPGILKQLSSDVPSNDLNDVLFCSRYVTYSPLNFPVDSWVFVDTFTHSLDFGVQLLYSMTGGYRCFYRQRRSGTWQTWCEFSITQVS